MIVGVVMAGVYQAFILPPRVMAGEVRGVRFSMGDLVERIRVLQGIDRYQGGQVDLSTIPFQLLTDLAARRDSASSRAWTRHQHH